VLQAHQPAFEIGTVNLDGEFKAGENKIEKQAAKAQVSGEQNSEQTRPLSE
jgi:hypothetical protein